jgi:undecaprenyl diphosphate synthase
MATTDIQLKHLALITDSLNEEQLSSIVDELIGSGVKVLSIYSDSQPLSAHHPQLKIQQKPLHSGKDQLLAKCKEILLNNRIDINKLSQGEFINFTAEDPQYAAPDLIIKVGNTESLEDALIIESSYAEIYFTNLDPEEFGREELKKAIDDFASRKRNFGG